MDIDAVQEDVLNVVLTAHVVTVFTVEVIGYISANYYAYGAVSLPIMDFLTGLIYLLPWTIAIYLLARFVLNNKTRYNWITSGILVEIVSKAFMVLFMSWGFSLSRIVEVPTAFLLMIFTQYALLFGIVSQSIKIYRTR